MRIDIKMQFSITLIPYEKLCCLFIEKIKKREEVNDLRAFDN